MKHAPAPAARRHDGILRRVLAQPAAAFSLGFLLLLGLLALFGAQLAPFDPTATNYTKVLALPDGQNWLGTDDLGRDTLSRLIAGARVALAIAAGSVLVAMLIGVPLGLLLGYRGGWTDRLGSRVLDMAEALPGVLVGFAVIAILGRGLPNLMIAIGLIFCMNFARLTRAVAMQERSKLYVEAATVGGLGGGQIVFRQILPNLAGPLVVQAAFFMGSALMVESALSFLGIGLDSTQASWGGMLDVAAHNQGTAPFLALPPGLAIVFTVLAFNQLGDGINDALGLGQRAGRGRQRGPVRRMLGKRVAGRDVSRRAPHSPPDTAGGPEAETVLSLRGVGVELDRPGPAVPLVEDANLEIGRAEILGLLGESGSGKSMLARAALGLLPAGTRLAGGQVLLEGTDLASLDAAALRKLRGSGIGVVFQDPMSALSPVHTVFQQLQEPLRIHRKLTRKQARAKAAELLDRVGVRNAAERLDDFPHQFSGGMAQRVAIAIALAAEPKVLIADEATSALDVTTQAQVLDLLLELREEYRMAVLMITHDLGVVAEICDRAAVLYAGQIVEVSAVEQLFKAPRHPYTAALMAANPTAVREAGRLPSIEGRVPLAGAWPQGCHFAERCVFSTDACGAGPIALEEQVRCVRSAQLADELKEVIR